MNSRQITITLLCLLMTSTTTIDVRTFNKVDMELPEIQITQQEQEIKKQEQNLLCADSKYLTYTNIDNVNIDWTYIEKNYYVDQKGYIREQGTNAIYVAMATNYQKNNYYTITTSDNQNFKVKVVDIKSDNHTTNKCFTTHDNSIVELWLTNKNNDFMNLGNSRVVGVSVVEVKGNYESI